MSKENAQKFQALANKAPDSASLRRVVDGLNQAEKVVAGDSLSDLEWLVFQAGVDTYDRIHGDRKYNSPKHFNNVIARGVVTAGDPAKLAELKNEIARQLGRNCGS